VNVVEELRSIAAREAASNSPQLGSRLDDAITALLGPGIGDHSEKFYRQYVVRIGGEWLIKDAERLAWMKQLEISAAPELLALISAGGYSVLVGRHWACTDEQLVPVDRKKHVLTPEAIRRFHRDMVVLSDHGMFHPFAGRGFAHWLIGETSGTIVLNSWSVLWPFEPRERAEMLSAVDRQLTWLAKPRMNRITETFGKSPVLLPVVHPVDRDTALRSIDVVRAAGCKGLFLINQGMSSREVLQLVRDVRARDPELWIGVNLLDHRAPDALSDALDQCDGRIDGIWADNAHIDEHSAAQPRAEEFVATRRARNWNGLYFGGVAFKYQRDVASADLPRSAAVAAGYMDVVCTSGPGTGQAADVDKVCAMREGLGDGALALASGVTPENVRAYMPYVDAFLVGTGIEASFGVIDKAKLAALLRAMAV